MRYAHNRAMHHTPNKRKHVKRAITCLLVMTAAWIVISLYWLAIIISINVVQILPDFYLINAINPLATGIATFATLLAALHVLRARICAAKYQRIAIWSVTAYSAVLIAHSLLSTIGMVQLHLQWHATRYISSASLPFPASIIFSESWATWLYTVPIILTELALLTLILPPALMLSNWAPARLRVARVFAVVFLCIALLPEGIPFLVDLGFLSVANHNMANLVTLQNVINASELLALIALAIFLFHLRKHASSLTRDPSHCATCDYPLEPAFTTCPECGTERNQEPTHSPIE